MTDEASFVDFQKLDIRVGKVSAVEPFPRARNPSYKVTVDFGEPIGELRSAAQATNYSQEELLGLQVVCVTNLAPRNIAGFSSEILILGVPDAEKPSTVSLLTPSRVGQLGGKVY